MEEYISQTNVNQREVGRVIYISDETTKGKEGCDILTNTTIE